MPKHVAWSPPLTLMSKLDSRAMAKKKNKSSQKSADRPKAADITEPAGAPKAVSAPKASDKPRAAARPSRRQRQQRMNIAIGAGIATVIIAAIAINVIREAGKPGERFRSQGNLHIASLQTPHVPYNSDPPTSGPHMPGLAAWGSYTTVQPDELLVHNMEDGGVIMWYELGTEEENNTNVDLLNDVARGYSRIVIAPRANLGSPYVLTAWTRLQRFDELDREGMIRFIEAYEGIDHHPRY